MNKPITLALAGFAACQILSPGAAHAQTVTWTDTTTAPQTGTFTASLDAVPSVTDQDTVVGLSQAAANAYTALAAIVRFNNVGTIDVRNGGAYAADVVVPYAALSSYHIRIVVNIPAHTYSVYLTPPGQPELALATNYAFRTEQNAVTSLTFLDEGASLGSVSISNLTLNLPGSCPYNAAAVAYGIGNDGCAGAIAEPAPYPALLAKYGVRRPPFDVAGVDYFVGVPPGPLQDPGTAPLPSGCAYTLGLVTCSKSNTTISGYDFSLHNEVRLAVPSGVSNITITGNNFGLASSCKDPVIDIRAGGALVISNNSFNGGGATCKNLAFGTVINGIYPAGTTMTMRYNLFYNTPQDVADHRGPASGAASIVEQYNLFYLQGFTGHPDGIQLNGGNFNPINLSLNTYYTSSPPNTVAGTQPMHIEAQLTAAISNATVAYNTLVTPGSCNAGRNWPTGCAVNFPIACKSDPGWVDSNTNFSAYGNYIDWSGAIAALTNAYNCPSTSWGKPKSNIDLNTGLALSP